MQGLRARPPPPCLEPRRVFPPLVFFLPSPSPLGASQEVVMLLWVPDAPPPPPPPQDLTHIPQNPPFESVQLSGFHVFPQLCSFPHCRIPDQFRHPKKKPYAHESLPISPSPSTLAATHLLSPWICQFSTLPVLGILQHVVFPNWLPSLGV